jgi:hypothetical protein
MRMLAPAVVLAAILAAGTALAASLGVTSTGITSYSAASVVPVSTCIAQADADTYVDGGNVALDFGDSTELRVKSSLVGDVRAFVRFDLDACSIPSGARVTAASLNLTLATAPLLARTYEARRVAAPWGETTITWNAQPALAGSATATVATGTTGGVTLSWDVLTDVQAFATGAAVNHGWRIADQSEGSLAPEESVFPSREAAANRPALLVSFYP